MRNDKWSNPELDSVCGPEWYGWWESNGYSHISTIVYANEMKKCGKLNFGNCWSEEANNLIQSREF